MKDRAVCFVCNIRIIGSEVTQCWRCGGDELIYEGHPDFELNWTHAYDD